MSTSPHPPALDRATSAAAPTALPASAAIPGGLEEEAQVQALAALARVPSSPRSLTPRMNQQYGSLFSRHLVPFTAGAGLLGVLAGLSVLNRPSVAPAFLAATVTCVALLLWRRQRTLKLLAQGVAHIAVVDHIHVHETHGQSNVEVWRVDYRYVVRGAEYSGSASFEPPDGREVQRAGFLPLVVDPANPERELPWLGALHA